MYAFLRFPGFRKKALTLSYDDGTVYDKKMVEILDRYGIKCTFNLNSGLMGKERRMTKDECIELFGNSHHEVAVHGKEHMSLLDVNVTFGLRDISDDRRELENMFGRIITGMAYAFGDYRDDTPDMLKHCGILYARTCVETERFDMPSNMLLWPSTCIHRNPRLFELLDKFLDSTPARHIWVDEPRLFYLFGHSYEFNDYNEWELLEEFCRKAGGRDDVWYATNMEIYEYKRAYDSLIYSYDGTKIKNPSAIDVYASIMGKEIMIPAGDTVDF